MKRETGSWHSPALGREMHVACFGHYGVPVVLFPTAGGDYLECERFLMIKVLAPLIDAGRIKVYACGGISSDAWLDPQASPQHKAWLQGRFDRYLHDELVPHVKSDCGGFDRLVAAGASLGAFNAVVAASRSPGAFAQVVAMSGTYDFDRWMQGHVNADYFFCQPTRFLPGLEGAALDLMRQTHFCIASGSGRYEAPGESQHLAGLLRQKGVPVDLEIWGDDAHHDWPTWRTMLPLFLDRMLP